MTDPKQAVADEVAGRGGSLTGLSHAVHAHAEVAWAEFASAKSLGEWLAAEGFAVQAGVAGLPTAFVATRAVRPCCQLKSCSSTSTCWFTTWSCPGRYMSRAVRGRPRVHRCRAAGDRGGPAPAGPSPRDLLADKGFSGRGFAAAQAERGTAVLVPPDRKQRAAMPWILLKVIAGWRNRVETTFSEITDRMELARHGARTFGGLLTRTAATIAAHTLRVCLTHD